MKDLIVGCLDQQLSFQQKNQKFFLGHGNDDSGSSDDGGENDERTSKRTFLSDSVHGSARHRKKKASNGLALASEFGQPHCFTTMTVNPYCREIQEMLLPGQTAYQRPDIVARVFHEKKRALIHNIKNGRYFGGLECEYIMHVIEYQFRGLPHVHIVYRLKGGSDHDDLPACKAFIKEYIITVMPIIKEDSNSEDKRYFEIVSNMHIHSCGKGPNGCIKKDGTCKFHFSDTPKPEFEFDINGYPIYARPTVDDCYVVSHVRKMLLDDPDGCHMNTTFCASNFSVIYLYKYLYKGFFLYYVYVHALKDFFIYI